MTKINVKAKNLDGTEGIEKAMKIDEMYLSPRSTRVLKERGIETLQQLYDMKDSDLLKFKSLGKKSVKEIREHQRDILFNALNKTIFEYEHREDILKKELSCLKDNIVVPLSKMEIKSLDIQLLIDLIRFAGWECKK